jgi:drug/metabolite transporter (DMT)-like permease
LNIPYAGEIAALGTAFCWTMTSLAFESAGKRVGSLQVNIIRLFMAFFFLSSLNYFFNGSFLPTGLPVTSWTWLLLSGVAGFLIGDLLLFQAFVVIGARISMLIMTLVPVMTAILSLIILGEGMAGTSIIGMIVTISAIIYVVSGRKKGEDRSVSGYGILLAIGGAFGQALGLVLSKLGMADFSPVTATQVRVIAGIIGFSILFTMLKRWHLIKKSLKDLSAVKRIATGAFFGPFLGVTLSLAAVQYTKAGIAATLMAISPILIIFPSRILFKEKIRLRDIIGSIITVAGVAIIFLS